MGRRDDARHTRRADGALGGAVEPASRPARLHDRARESSVCDGVDAMGIRSAVAIAIAALALSGCRKAETVSAEAKAPGAAAVSLSVLRVKPQPFAASVAITGSL